MSKIYKQSLLNNYHCIPSTSTKSAKKIQPHHKLTQTQRTTTFHLIACEHFYSTATACPWPSLHLVTTLPYTLENPNKIRVSIPRGAHCRQAAALFWQRLKNLAKPSQLLGLRLGCSVQAVRTRRKCPRPGCLQVRFVWHGVG